MSVRSVKTSYTSASSQSISSFSSTMTTTTTMSMTSPASVLGSIDLNMSPSLSKLPPGLSLRPLHEKRFNGRPRSGSLSLHGGSSVSPYTNPAAKNTYHNQWNINGSGSMNSPSQGASGSRSFNGRPGNKRYPQGMRLPTSSYSQTQNQHRRASFSSVHSPRPLSMQHVFSGYGGSPVYQRTSRFDPFEDSSDSTSPAISTPLLSSPLAPSPSINSRSSPTLLSSTTTAANPTYTHYYYYDPTTNSPTLAYADADNRTPHLLNTSINTPASHGNLKLNSSANLLLETIINGRNNSNRKTISRSPSPPPQSPSYPPVVEVPSAPQPPQPQLQNLAQPSVPTEPSARPQTRTPSPPHSPRPRSAAISRPSPNVGPAPNPVQNPVESATTISPPPPPLPMKPAVKSKPVKSQRDAIANIVASMMLNRADGCGRRGRRCGSGEYVKSGLSRVIFVE